MNEVDCKLKDYDGRVRVLKGDPERLDKICEQTNKNNKKRDGFLHQGVNRCNRSHAVHFLLDFFEKHGQQSIEQVKPVGAC